MIHYAFPLILGNVKAQEIWDGLLAMELIDDPEMLLYQYMMRYLATGNDGPGFEECIWRSMCGDGLLILEVTEWD